MTSARDASKPAARRPVRALVTGGGGFLGRAIVGRLLERGDDVRIFSRGDYPDLRRRGVETVRGDIADRPAVIDACRNRDVVFHVAGKPGIWGDYAEYHEPNVGGTRNVVAGCKAHDVPRLVYTSSPSVVFGAGDIEGADESIPYPDRHRVHYSKTKAIAERIVLDANCSDLATVSLRPHLIWGPGDNHLLSGILGRAESLRRIGRHDPVIDCVYVDNAADAHILAADRLEPGSAVAGKAYFISNGEPRGLWQIVNGILRAAGRPPVTRRMPKVAASAIATICETIHKTLRLRREPCLTRFLVYELSTAHWFDISAARRDLGYAPRVSIDEGLRRLEAWLRSRRSPPSHGHAG